LLPPHRSGAAEVAVGSRGRGIAGSRVHRVALIGLVAVSALAPIPVASGPSQNAVPGSSDPGVHLTNVAEAAGLRFVYQHSPTPEKYFVESVPGGVAVFDYNGDGRPDVFFTNGAKTPTLEKASPLYSNRLFRNDGNMRFTDVTSTAGVAGIGYAIG